LHHEDVVASVGVAVVVVVDRQEDVAVEVVAVAVEATMEDPGRASTASVKSVSRKVTAPSTAGTVLMKILLLKRRMSMSCIRMVLIQIGTQTQGPPTTSPVI
jgi:hypothetical protein